MTLFLASASPRRAELLQQIGVPFRVAPVDVDETPAHNESLHDYVARLSHEKCLAAQRSLPAGSVVLAADTAGACNGTLLTKPANESDAVAMLLAMSGRRHIVSTAISVGCNERIETRVVNTQVCFRQIDATEAQHYWTSGEPCDKAGGYAIQGFGAVFVERIEGSYSAVVGLPLFETAALLQQFGIHCWQQSLPTTSATTTSTGRGLNGIP